MSPFGKPLLGEIGAFRVWILQRLTKLVATETIQLVANGLSDEFAAVLFPPVNVSDEIVG
jgi:hypothetical protein